MRLVMTLLCRDEADIIESTIQFHLDQGVDHLIVTDNGSVDGTREIISDFLGTGRVSLIDEPEHNHDQAIWVTRMASIGIEQWHADWIIHGDADEFWWPACGDLKQILEAIPSATDVLHVQRKNFLPPASDPDPMAGETFHQVQQIRERISLNSLGQPLPAKICHRSGPNLQVTDGNHRLLQGGTPLQANLCSSIEILHFPIRSYKQFERKVKHGAEALARNKRISPQVGSTWRNLYRDFYCKGKLESYYRQLRPPVDVLHQHLKSGELLMDPRLHNALGHGES
jgi:hypothetical protein